MTENNKIISSYDSKLFKNYKRLIPEGLNKSDSIIYCLRGNNNSNLIILATSNCKLTSYYLNIDTFELLDEIGSYTSWVQKCVLTIDNTLLAVLAEQIIYIYNAKMRFILITKFKPHDYTINNITWTQKLRPLEQQYLITAGKDGTVRFWKAKSINDKIYTNTRNAHEPDVTLGVFQDPSCFHHEAFDDPGHKESVMSVAVSVDDKYVASGGVDYRILLWNLDTAEYLGEYEGHIGVVMDLCWATSFPDRFASAGSDKKVLLWVVGQFTPVCWFDGHLDIVESLKFLKEDYLVSYGRDSFFCVWNTRDATLITDPKKNINSKRITKMRWKNSIHSRGWANVMCLTENGDHVCIVTSQLLASFVLLKLTYYDEDWFELNPVEKVGRMIWNNAKLMVLGSSYGRQVIDFVMPPDIGIERKKSHNFGRQISWSWNNTILEEVNAKKNLERKLSKQYSGQIGNSIKKAISRGFSRGFSRGISRGLSRGLSRGMSSDDIFDPSQYQLSQVEEEKNDPEKDKLNRMRGTMVKNIPAKQQYGERPGAKIRGWAGKIFHSKDYDAVPSEKNNNKNRINEEDLNDTKNKKNSNQKNPKKDIKEEDDNNNDNDSENDYFKEKYSKDEDEEEADDETKKAVKHTNHINHRKHHRKSKAQVVPVDDDEWLKD